MKSHSMLRFLIALFTFAAIAGAVAGDNAQRGFSLFSPDGRYFAFEQFGIRDGSGFPFSEIFVIDLDQDEWVKGTPVRQRPEDEELSLGIVRRQAWEKAGAILHSLKIEEPGELLASNPVTERGPDRHHLTFARFFPSQGWNEETHLPPEAETYTLTLEQIAFPLARPCWGEDPHHYGFSLAIRNDTNESIRQVRRDATIPSSRFCARGYDIAEVFVYRMKGEKERFVALIGVYMPGFEGLDRRLIAMPFSLP